MTTRLLAASALVVAVVTLALSWALLTLWEGTSALLDIIALALERNS
jgi:hypothetical protein